MSYSYHDFNDEHKLSNANEDIDDQDLNKENYMGYSYHDFHDKHKLANANEAVDGQDLSSYFTSRNLKQKYDDHYLDMANQLRINVEQYCHFIKIKDELTNEGYNVIVDHDKNKVKILKEI